MPSKTQAYTLVIIAIFLLLSIFAELVSISGMDIFFSLNVASLRQGLPVSTTRLADTASVSTAVAVSAGVDLE